jgi:hypothetical protein
MLERRALRLVLVALIPVLVFPLYGQSSCNPCPTDASNPCRATAYRSSGVCLYDSNDGVTCDDQGAAGICSDGQCVPSECGGAPAYSLCNDPVGGGPVGVCIEDQCVLSAPYDECVRGGVGRINCCSQDGCRVASGAYCNAPLDGVSCDPTGVEPVDQPGQDGICVTGTCVASSGPCLGQVCSTSISDPCARDYCDTSTGQCAEWIVQTYVSCVVAGAQGICQGGTCTPIGGGECQGAPCTSTACQVAACRLPCLYSPAGCSPEELSNPVYVCEHDDVPDGAPCVDQPGECQSGVCVPDLDCRDFVPTEYAPTPCNDYDPCTVDACDFSDGSCVHTPLADGTSCAENEQGETLALCQNGVCLYDLCIDRDCGDPDGNSCTGVCISPYGICDDDAPLPNGTTCENNGQCLNGFCQPIITDCRDWPDPDGGCDDNRDCTDDFCCRTLDCNLGFCENPPKPNGTRCTSRFGQTGQCLSGNCITQ